MKKLYKGKTDWEAIRNIKDEDIDFSDIPEMGKEFWKDAKIIRKAKKRNLTVRYDEEVIQWFKNQGKGYQTLMNDVLKTYVQHQKEQMI